MEAKIEFKYITTVAFILSVKKSMEKYLLVMYNVLGRQNSVEVKAHRNQYM